MAGADLMAVRPMGSAREFIILFCLSEIAFNYLELLNS